MRRQTETSARDRRKNQELYAMVTCKIKSYQNFSAFVDVRLKYIYFSAWKLA